MRYFALTVLMTLSAVSAHAQTRMDPMSSSASQTRPLTREELQRVAPALADYNSEVLFGDVWKRPGLGPRDRSLITITTLIARGNIEQLSFHMNRALDNGVTKEEIQEVITHLAFYAGWPQAMSAVRVARDVFDQRDAAKPAK